MPLLSLGGQQNCLLSGRCVLSTDFNCSGNIKSEGFRVFANILVHKLLNGLELLFLDVAVEQQSSVVFVVVSHRSKLRLCAVFNSSTGASDEFL